MPTSDQTANPLVESFVAQLVATRDVERQLFGALDAAIRDRPVRPGDWSPKDHQAHLTAWKAQQVGRFRAVRAGGPFPTDDRETDEINAGLQALRADWPWEAIDSEADAVHGDLVAEIRATGDRLLIDSGRLIAGTFGNGPFHAATHFGWLVEAGIGMDPAVIKAFIDDEERLLADTVLPDPDRGTGLYGLACVHALAGRLDRARPLLRVAFRLRPDLGEVAVDDPDLIAFRDELPSLVD